MLLIWNVVRWLNMRSRLQSLQSPLKRDNTEPPKYEYIPELDFQKMERDQSEPKGG